MIDGAKDVEKEHGYIDEWVEAEQGQFLWGCIAKLIKDLEGRDGKEDRAGDSQQSDS
jgi:hypothetical protein